MPAFSPSEGKAVLSKLDRYFEEVLCTFFLSVVVGSVLLQVILRFVFHSAAAWAEETAVYGMIFAVYLGACMAVRDRAHIRITLLVNRLPRPAQVGCIVVADMLWVGFVLVAAMALTVEWVFGSLLQLRLIDPLETLLRYAATIAAYPCLAWLFGRAQQAFLR